MSKELFWLGEFQPWPFIQPYSKDPGVGILTVCLGPAQFQLMQQFLRHSNPMIKCPFLLACRAII
jgi:hypothetical protein